MKIIINSVKILNKIEKMADEKGNHNIIIDNGSAFIKAGFSDEKEPKSVFPTCIGYPKNAGGMVEGEKIELLVGSKAEAKCSSLKLYYPIESGNINNWIDMEKIWGHIFTDELKVNSGENNVILTEATDSSKEAREKMAQIMFETFNVPGLYIGLQSLLSLYTSGKTTGIVVDSGEDVTRYTPIFDGFIISPGVIQQNLGGRHLTEYLARPHNGIIQSITSTNPTTEKNIFQVIKEKSCYVVPFDFEKELKLIKPFDYELPDGTHVIVKDQRIKCPEILFKPSLIGKLGKGIGQTCNDSIQKCDNDVRKDLYNSIILSGGNSMFNGLPERFTTEIKNLAPESTKKEINVIASPERKYSVWIGGSILSSISTFKNLLIHKFEYEESGAMIVHKK